MTQRNKAQPGKTRTRRRTALNRLPYGAVQVGGEMGRRIDVTRDGNCRLLLPDMLAVGVNSTAPCEVAAGMDPVALRAQFGRDLRIGGGFDKRIVAAGPAAVKAELARLAPVIREGGACRGSTTQSPPTSLGTTTGVTSSCSLS